MNFTRLFQIAVAGLLVTMAVWAYETMPQQPKQQTIFQQAYIAAGGGL